MNIDYTAAQRAVSDPDTLALPLILIAESILEDPALTYGPDSVEPGTLFGLMEDRLSVELPEAARNRLQAVLTMRRSELFENDVDFFTAVALTFADGQLGDMVFGMVEDISKTEAMWAIIEASLCDPYMGDFSPAVSAFLDELMEEPEEPAEEEEDDLFEVFQTLANQLRALRLEESALEAITKRAAATMEVITARFGPAAVEV